MPSSRKHSNLQFGIQRAKRDGRFIVEPKPNEIQIDIDGHIEYQFYKKQRAILDKAGVTEGWRTRITKSEHAGHLHITITVPIPTMWEYRNVNCALTLNTAKGRALRVGLAAILCDDPHRAAFNWCRVVKDTKYPIAFFEKGKKK
jgi:hypothetical protein